MRVVVRRGNGSKRRLDEFRQLRLPVVLCYTKIVPVDEVVTLTLFYREDDQLARLMLDDAQRCAASTHLWDELHYVSQDALTQVDAFAQLLEYALAGMSAIPSCPRTAAASRSTIAQLRSGNA